MAVFLGMSDCISWGTGRSLDYLSARAVGLMDVSDIGAWWIVFLLGAAFFAGFVDSIAGGGGMISLPAMLLAGIPPHFALGSNKFMSSCGTSMALYTYGRHHSVDWRIAARGVGFALVGSYCGSRLALAIDQAMLGRIFIFLLPIAAAICFSPLRKLLRPTGQRPKLLKIACVCFPVGMYDGFFGPGTGSILLLAMYLFLGVGLVAASGTTKSLNLASNIGATIAFLMQGKVLFLLALPMAVCNIMGNVTGSRLALKRGASIVKYMLIFSLTLLMVTLVWRYFIQA